MPRLYRFLPASAALATLESMKLRLSRLSSLNDPFDCRPAFAGANGYPEEFREQLSEFFLKRRSEALAVLCFSRSWKQHLLWSHYADHHRGMALVFRQEIGEGCIKVRYRKNRASVDLNVLRAGGDDAAFRRGFIAPFEVKAPAWRYECETRLVVPISRCEPQGGHFVVPIHKVMLIGVILGIRCEVSAAHVRLILEKKEMHGAKIWKAASEPDEFALVRKEVFDELSSPKKSNERD